jgi:hypothetical protein
MKFIFEHAPAQAWFAGVIFFFVISNLIVAWVLAVLVVGYTQLTSLLRGDPSPYKPRDLNESESTAKAKQSAAPKSLWRRISDYWEERYLCYYAVALMAAEIHRDHTKSFSVRAIFEQMANMASEGNIFIGYGLFGLIVLSFALGLAEMCTGFRGGIWIRKGLEHVGIYGGLVRGKEKERIGDEEAGYANEKGERLEV